MKYISFSPSGLEPNQSYRVEVSNSIAPDVIIYSQHNIISNQTVIVPIQVPGTYIVKLFNMADTNNICINSQYNEQTINVFFPIITYIVSNTDCATNSYTITLTITNPETSGNNIEFGWSYSISPNSITNWTTNNILTLPADGNNINVFVRYDGCVDFITSVKKDPCVNCNIEILDIAVSCSNTIPPPEPTNDCFTYKIINGNSSSFVWYIDCSSNLLENIIVNPNEEVLICSKGVPSGQTGTTITLVGNNCPSE